MKLNGTLYDKLQEVLGTGKKTINVLEDNIDSRTQLEYFEVSREFSSSRSKEEIIRDKECILDKSISIEKKKEVLLELASLNSIEAYRAIEKYLHQPDIKLYDWASLALHESRMQLESNFLDESKVLISTGLGGKGFMLRYFIVLFTPNGKKLDNLQKHLITKETRYFLNKHCCEFEDIEFDDSFASILCMIPLNVAPNKIFKTILDECNLFGNFLFNDFIITNVRAMNKNEIRELLLVNNIY